MWVLRIFDWKIIRRTSGLRQRKERRNERGYDVQSALSCLRSEKFERGVECSFFLYLLTFNPIRRFYLLFSTQPFRPHPKIYYAMELYFYFPTSFTVCSCCFTSSIFHRSAVVFDGYSPSQIYVDVCMCVWERLHFLHIWMVCVCSIRQIDFPHCARELKNFYLSVICSEKC